MGDNTMYKEIEGYYYDCTRMGFTKLDVKAWKEGSGDELKRWFGVGLYKTKFIFEGSNVLSYNDIGECDELDKALNEKLNEELFDKMCNRYFELMKEAESTNNKKELYKITVKCWPMWIVFDILDNYPYFGTKEMLRRLMRIKTTWQDWGYKLAERLNDEIQKQP